MRRGLIIIALIAAFGGLCWRFPPVRVVSLKRAHEVKAQTAFDAARFTTTFWSERFTPALDTAPDAPVVLAALVKDSQSAAKRFGHTVGMSDTVYYLMRGSGTVVSVESKGVGVSLHGEEADLMFNTGLLFGNTARDATGLLPASEFPNSQDFNDVSTQLNRIVESRVMPGLKTNATVGRKLRFVVAAEVEAESGVERPLKVVPLRVEFE